MTEWRESDIEQIEKFLEGSLPEEEMERVKARMEEDTNFRLQVNDLAELKAGIEQAGRKELLKEIRSWEEREQPVKPRQLFMSTARISMGIAALLVVGLSVYFLWPAPSQEDLFQQYFEPYPNVIMPTVRGEVTADSSMLALAFRAYDQERWEEALGYFKEVNQGEDSLAFYVGNTYLALGQPEQAIPIFEKLIGADKIFNEQAQWYLALAYWKMNDKEKARMVLLRIVKNGGSYAVKANVILQSNFN